MKHSMNDQSREILGMGNARFVAGPVHGHTVQGCPCDAGLGVPQLEPQNNNLGGLTDWFSAAAAIAALFDPARKGL